MSRTYRRMRQKRGKHNQNFIRWCWSEKGFARFLRDTKCTMTTPSWWVREMMTVPQRAEVRAKLQQLHQLRDLEDTPEFPLAKKPHQYFW